MTGLPILSADKVIQKQYLKISLSRQKKQTKKSLFRTSFGISHYKLAKMCIIHIYKHRYWLILVSELVSEKIPGYRVTILKIFFFLLKMHSHHKLKYQKVEPWRR